MGLDMYAYTARQALSTPVDFCRPDDATQLFYWRKHPNPHGFFKRLYREKGGNAEDFNLAPVVLDSAAIDAFESTVRNRLLPEASGFYFGQSGEEDSAGDLKFVAKASV